MLSSAQEKRIKSLHTKKGRQKHGLCLVEGAKVIETAGNAVEFTFTRKDSAVFDSLVSTETPQDIAAVARIPEWSMDSVTQKQTIVVLDGVQDPGNVGAILRLALAFDASLVLVEAADVTNPKVVRSSVGALFQVPWMRVSRATAPELLAQLNRHIYRLEKREGAVELDTVPPATEEPKIIIAGSEGQGIFLDTSILNATSVYIPHTDALESLNVANSAAIALYATR